MRQTLFVRAQRWSWAAALLAACSSEPPAANAPPSKSVPQASIPAGAESQESAVTSCSPGYELECDNGCDTPRNCNKPTCRCIPIVTTYTGIVTPYYQVTHVLYAPPGKMSSVQYSQGSVFGSTTTESSSHKEDVKVTASVMVGAPSVYAGSGVSISGQHVWGSTDTRAVDVAIETTTALRKPAQSDLINHDDDEIWFLMHPRIDVTIDKSVRETRLYWRLSPDQAGARIYYAYVKDLKNPAMMPANVKKFLADNNITEADFPQILRADPLAYDSMMLPASSIDRNRFQCLTSLPYMPPNDPGQAVGTQTYTLSRKDSVMNTTATEDTQSVGFTLTDSGGFAGVFKASLSWADTWTWTHTSTQKLTTGSNTADSFTVGQPDSSYTGPPLLSVYVDKIYKTYAFNLDWTGCDP